MMLRSPSAVHLISTEGKSVMNELVQGKEFANLLRNQLKNPSSQELKRFLITQILEKFENALVMLNSSGISAEETAHNVVRSPKRRKMSEKVKIRVGTEQECLDDGYFWRKYGQKDILNSKHPRGYYRCTHRFSQDCLATKQVQRTDKDPADFEVTYVGRHTCSSVSTSVVSSPTKSMISSIKLENEPRKTKEPMLCSTEMDQKTEIFRTFSFSDVQFVDVGRQENINVERFSPKTPTLWNWEDVDLSFLDTVDYDADFSFNPVYESLS